MKSGVAQTTNSDRDQMAESILAEVLQMPEGDAPRIAEALEATRNLVNTVDERGRDMDRKLSEMSRDLQQIAKVTEHLQVLVWTGNGHDSLLTRVTLIEREVAALSGRMKSSEAEKAKLKVALIGSLTSVAVAILSAVVALLK